MLDERIEKKEQKPLLELVGAAYVHGIMDGEGMDGIEKVERFLLK
jgi:hypothetical protein